MVHDLQKDQPMLEKIAYVVYVIKAFELILILPQKARLFVCGHKKGFGFPKRSY